jgi:hypothetical protein
MVDWNQHQQRNDGARGSCSRVALNEEFYHGTSPPPDVRRGDIDERW